MRNIVLHRVTPDVHAPTGILGRVIVVGHAFGLRQILVRIEGPTGAMEASGDVDDSHHWVVEFDDPDGFARAGIAVGSRLRILAADPADRDGCYSAVCQPLRGL